jgi:GT2 family glycosyltransferase/predicted Zn-dependent protease
VPARYLFGPVSLTFAEQNLARQRRAGACLAFDAEGRTDLAIGPDDTWGRICSRFPPGWKPDFVALNLPYTSIPDAVWSAPVPLVGLAADWPLLWHYYRRRLRACDLILTDPAGVAALAREGIPHAQPANLYGYERAFLDLPTPPAATPRDIDVLFVGNLNPGVQRGRLPWLGRLARLGKCWRVAVRTAVFGDAYRRLLGRARVVFDHVSQPRCSRRAFEAAAAGALVFEDAGNPEMAGLLRDRQECVCYRDDDLEALLEYYLGHEDERRKLAEAARSRVADCGFEDLWAAAVGLVERELPDLRERAAGRPLPGRWEALLVRGWQALNAPFRSDPTLARDLEAAVAAEPHSAALYNALGLALTRLSPDPALAKAVAEVAAEQFRRAAEASPGHVLARLNLAESREAVGDADGARDQARQALAALARAPEPDPSALDAGHFHADFGPFRAEWERAAWANAGRPRAEARAKRDLLRWRLHGLLGKLTEDPVHYYEAFLARPDLPASAAALGCTLTSKGYPLEALAPLRRSLDGNPFDRDAARALGHALGATGDREGRRALVEDRRLLSRAAPQAVPAEAWFSEPPPSPGDLASIIILCCDQLDCTRLCLESVLRHTRAPYELVLVDNASSDGTPAYLEEVRTRRGPARVEVIRNETNVGFPAGCNQALARARGRYVVFLNNDTVVTPGWLDGMVALSLRDWPAFGLIGPVTNAAPDAQGIRPGYGGLEGLDDFAARRRAEFGDRSLAVNRLTGFCLLARRDVLERVGGFDERYGLGFFDDDDLGLRARDAGFRLAVALGVYVHHFGSRTFRGLGIDTRGQLTGNMDLFREKWGAEHAAGYRLIEPAPKPPADDEPLADSAPSMNGPDEPAGVTPAVAADSPGEPPTVTAESEEISDAPDESSGPVAQAGPCPQTSLCMIVRNEERHLPGCLETAADLFDEIIVVDTGSADGTRDIAARFGARVFEFPWVDSFAAARNECLRHAAGRWVLWLDADDRLDEDNRGRLRELFRSLGDEVAAYAMKVRSVLDAHRTAFRLLDQVRLFPNHPQVRWDYRVHEQILPGVNRLGGHVRWADVVIDHVGYQEAGARRGKLERNLRLLRMDDAERPDDPFTLFNLGWTLMDLGQTDEALPRLRQALERSSSDSSIVRKLYHLIAVAGRQLGDKEGAAASCREGLEKFPDDTELLLEEALMALEAKDFARAEPGLLRLLETRPGQYFGSADDGVRGYRTRHLLAGHYAEQGRGCEAEIHLRVAVAQRPRFTPGWLALGELYLRQSRWADLDEAVRRLEGEGAAVEAAVFRARGHQARNELPAARRELEELLPRAPQALGPRVLLSHILLQDNRDPAAAETVLREVIALDPGNGEARHNLSVLLSRQGRPIDA